MKNNLVAVLAVFIVISSLTFFYSGFKPGGGEPEILGSFTTTRVYDDGNGTLYVEYSSPIEVYNAVSSWQSRNPGRTIYSSVSLATGTAKYFAVLLSYIGK